MKNLFSLFTSTDEGKLSLTAIAILSVGTLVAVVACLLSNEKAAAVCFGTFFIFVAFHTISEADYLNKKAKQR